MPITDIKNQFIKVIQYSQGINNPQVDKLFDQWLEAKRDIIEAWDGKYIIEFPDVFFELGKEEKRSRLGEFIDIVADRYDNEKLAAFLEWATIDEIFANKIERDYYIASDEKISAGTKLIKAFKYFETNESLLRELQDRLSMIIQENKIRGTLCFSVHPLDFLSASENTYHWRSCHALDGDYRAGNLSYLLDKSTIMCYLKTPNEMVKLPNFPEDVLWNSKKWRMWVYLSDAWDSLFAGRQYPFFSRTALDFVKINLLASLKKNAYWWSNWHDDYITSFPRTSDSSFYGSDSDLAGRHICMRYNIYKMTDLVTDCENPLHFNDLLQSSCYVPFYCWSRGSAKKDIHFSIGALVPCLHCDGGHAIYRSNTMRCDPCDLAYGDDDNDEFAYCECCESRGLRENMIWVDSIEAYICQHCYEAYTSQCQRCGETWYSVDIRLDRESNEWLCPWCRRGNVEIDWDEYLPF